MNFATTRNTFIRLYDGVRKPTTTLTEDGNLISYVYYYKFKNFAPYYSWGFCYFASDNCFRFHWGNNKTTYYLDHECQKYWEYVHFNKLTTKYRTRFVAWMWRSRESVSRREGHPDRMWECIAEADGDIEMSFG
jgi:hypothetical protein